MIPDLLIQIALIIMVVYNGYKAYQLFDRTARKPWLDILFHISFGLFSLSFLI